MSIGLVGKKIGMMRLFTEEGVSIPVSVVEAPDNRVVYQKTVANDGYLAVQVAIGERKASHVSKAMAGHYAKAGVAPGRKLAEFRLNAGSDEIGTALTVEQFSAGQKVDVTGTSKGKGFAGVIKRHHFAMQDATHGNSLSHRVHGSTGQRQTPGRVFKGKRMAGHMGNERQTAQNLVVVKIDLERRVLMIKGAIPGAPGGDVIVRPAAKIRRSAEGK